MRSVLNWISRALAAIAGNRPKIERTLDLVLEMLPVAYDIVAIVAAITPSKLDDVTLAAVRTAFPKLFEDVTPHEKKLYLLATATELLKRRYPEASTSTARLAAQFAYVLLKDGATVASEDP